MGQMPNKYHITDDGKVFRVNEDGSFSEIGDVNKLQSKQSIITDTSSAINTVNTGNIPEKPNDYFKISIALAVLFCIPLGLIAISNAYQVNKYWEQGEYDKAIQASKRAKGWCVATIVVGIFIILFLVQ